MEEVPLLRQLSAKYSGTAHIVGVSTDTSLGRVDVVVKEKAMAWPILADGRGFEGPIPTAYHVQGTPDLFVLDAEGRIFKRLGTATEIDTTLQGLLAARERAR
jgi:hypothetical protein